MFPIYSLTAHQVLFLFVLYLDFLPRVSFLSHVTSYWERDETTSVCLSMLGELCFSNKAFECSRVGNKLYSVSESHTRWTNPHSVSAGTNLYSVFCWDKSVFCFLEATPAGTNLYSVFQKPHKLEQICVCLSPFPQMSDWGHRSMHFGILGVLTGH